MQAVTARPWYWRRRPRPRTSARALRRLRLDWRLLDAGQIRHLIRVESSLVTSAPAPGRERGWRLEDFTSLRQPITEQQAQHKRAPGFTPREGDMLIVDGVRWPIDGPWPWATGGKATGGATTGGAATGAVTTGGSTSGAASVALATVLLLILALLLRAADKCRARQLVKTAARRRQSEEWPIPNVAATSLSVRMSGDADGGGDLDCPPPYAAVADTPPLPTNKQPPPPYSACCGDDSPLYHDTPGVNDSRVYNARHEINDNALYHDRPGVNDSRMNVRHETGSVDIECEVFIDTDRNVRRVAFYNTSLRANERVESTVDNDCEATGETERRVSFNNTISVADDNPNARNVADYSNMRDPRYNNVSNMTTAIDCNYTGSRNNNDSGGAYFCDRTIGDFGDSKTIVVNMDFDLAPKERHLLV